MMKRKALAAVLFALAVAWAAAVDARPVLAEPPAFEPTRVLHVSPFGDDANDGLALERAFRSISAAAAAVQPGDLVLVRGGTYFEHVHLTVEGTAERPIVFRAAPGETALVIAGRRPEGWTRIAETRFAYEAPHDAVPNWVLDERFLARYVEVTDLATLDETPGAYIYDEDEQNLAVHALRSLPPDEAGVRVIGFTVGSGVGAAPGERGYALDKGIWPRAPHNRVEGFHIAYQPFGIQLRADFTEAWNNTVYGCAVTGIQTHTGEGTVLANNVSFLNDGSGVHVSSSATGARVAGNLSWGNTQKGPFLHRSSGGHEQQLALYGRVHDPVVEGNLVLDGINPLERGTRLVRYKSALGTVTTRRNTLVGGSAHVGWGERALYEYNTIVGGNFRVRGGLRPVVDPETAEAANSEARGNLYLRRLDEAQFADPERWDFRQRAGSPHLGGGAWPEAAPVRYVSPEGDDQADGKTPATAWRTLGRAASAVLPGETVYVLPGEYPESVTVSVQGTASNPAEFLTYGRGRVVLDGGGRAEPAVAFRGAEHVKMDGFIFRNYSELAVAVSGGGPVELVDNVFDGAGTAVEVSGDAAVTVENATFADCGTGVSARDAAGRLVLRNNLFVRGRSALADLDGDSRAVLVSERNAFAGPDAQGQLAAWRGRIQEGHPSLLAEVEVQGPDYTLPPLSRYAIAGLGRKPLGARGEAPDESPIAVEGFRAVYAAPDRAIVEWYTPHDYPNATLSWRGPDGQRHRERINQYGFGQTLRETRQRVALPDLTPETEYTLTLDLRTPDGRTGSAEAQFATPGAHRDPATLYVSPQGSDDNDGLAPDRPLASLTAAAFAANPGDTILVGPGVYAETMALPCGGLDPERRLTVRSERRGEAIIDLGEVRPSAIVVDNVNHVTFDGFRITGLMYSSIRHAVSISNAEDVEVKNFLFERRPEGGVSCQLVRASRVRNLRITNNLFQAGFNNIQITHGDDITVDRNTFYRGGVSAIQLHGQEDATFRVTNNIFYDTIAAAKVNAAVIVTRPTDNLTVSNNLYHRDRAVNMGLVGFRWTRDGQPIPWSERAATVEELHERFGVGQGDLVADPMFEDPENGDFRLQPGSPAIGMAADGGDVGMQDPPAGL